MLIHLKAVLTPDEVRRAREVLAVAPWGDGRVTSGEQSALVKNNLQLPEQSEAMPVLRKLILQGLQRQSLFFSAALPKHISPPMFNAYTGDTNAFGDHVDTAIRYVNDGSRVRTDLSCTVFLSNPEEYAGGELVMVDHFKDQQIKLPAGDMILYPGNTVHRVNPVTEGTRFGAFFWVESMVRSLEQRTLLLNMDQHLMRLRSTVETDPAIVGLTSTYHNLLRLWADT